MPTPRGSKPNAHRRTLGRWIDDLIRTIERKAAAPAGPRRSAVPSSGSRPPLRLRRDLNLVLGL